MLLKGNYRQVVIALAVLACTPWTRAQTTYFVEREAIGSGGGIAAGTGDGGAFTVIATIGAPDVGTSSGGDYTVVGGFWAGHSTIDAVDDNFIVSLSEKRRKDPRIFKLLANDELGAAVITEGYTLGLREVASVGDPPVAVFDQTGMSIIILALVDGSELRVRIFDANGVRVIDADEESLTKGLHFDDLKEWLQSQSAGAMPSEERTQELIASAGYVSGFTPGIRFNTPEGPMDFTRSAKRTIVSNRTTVTYFPALETPGIDTFAYTLRKGGESDSAVVSVSVFHPVNVEEYGDLDPIIDGDIALLNHLSSGGTSSPKFTALLNTLNTHGHELNERAYNDRDLVSGLTLPAFEPIGLNIEANNLLALVESGQPLQTPKGQLLQTLDFFRAGLSALAVGQGDTVQFTEEMVESLRTLQDLIVEDASPALRTALEESNIVNNLEDIVGEDFNQAAETIGVDPDGFKVEITDHTPTTEGFSIATIKLVGFTFSLWKSTSLDADDWTKLDHVESDGSPGYIILTDPDPGNRAFYYLEATRVDN